MTRSQWIAFTVEMVIVFGIATLVGLALGWAAWGAWGP